MFYQLECNEIHTVLSIKPTKNIPTVAFTLIKNTVHYGISAVTFRTALVPIFQDFMNILGKYKSWTKTTATASRTREQCSLAVRHQTKNEVHSITYR